ncbi:hypothetical protein COLO4_03270 [Corchorus olitorius]|uniref:Uncharacterized protein n=1 Tax=Corchorus olitorius TaxID=93759 RepID=A0A1R3KZD6_9ROSI|nr:hypothetical protein COLO4_03270 [Corchorus olitorius]
MTAASSISRGIVAIKPLYSSTQNGKFSATSTRMSPDIVLNRCRPFSTQIVGTIAGGIIKPTSTSRSSSGVALPRRRCITYPAIPHNTTSASTDTTVSSVLFQNARNSI